MSYLTNPYMVIAPVPAGLAISGSHGYNFGGTSVDEAVYGDMITEQELGTATTSIEKADMVAINSRGANAQTSTIILALGGTGTGGVRSNVIQEYSIGTTTNATDKANLNQTPDQDWTKCYSTTHAYTLGGWYSTGANLPTDMIEEYEFGTTTNATDKANLSITCGANCGGTDGTYAYSYAGFTYPFANIDAIQQYEMGTGTTSVDVANATAIKRVGTCTQNTTLLICNGGYTSGYLDVIEEFTMATTSNATDKANLVLAQATFSGWQTTTHGYTSGGASGSISSAIYEYEFGTTTNAGTKGDLLTGLVNQFAGGSGTP